MIDHRYPIGKFEFPNNPTLEDHKNWITDLADLPEKLSSVVEPLNESQLATPYREGGWTVRQVIHHLADSHMNAYCRTRLALTEERPAVKSWDETLWAELFDAKTSPVNSSILIIGGIHARWVELLKTLNINDWKREIYIPYFEKYVSVEQITGIYAWHGKHHLSHIKLVK